MAQFLLMLLMACNGTAEAGPQPNCLKHSGNAQVRALGILGRPAPPLFDIFAKGLEPADKGRGTTIIKAGAHARSAAKSTDAPPSSRTPVCSPETARPGSVPDGQAGVDVPQKTKEITLRWEAQKDPTPAGYKIYYDTKSGPPYRPDPADYAAEGPPPIIVDGNIAEITLHGLTDDKDYFFAVTAFDSSGGPESPFSNEVASPPEGRASAEAPGPGPEAGVEQGKAEGKGTKGEEALPDPTPAAPKGPSVVSEDSRALAGGDVLEIHVPGQPEMSTVYDVAPDGNIYMMSIGRVSVEGLRLADLERGLTPKLAKFMEKGEKISVKLLKSERYIQIRGGVRYPGWYRVPTVTPVRRLIDTAGGLLEGVVDVGMKLRRETRDGYREMRVTDEKIVLQPNDVLMVPSPRVYQKRVDAGDLLFINVPGRAEGKDQYFQDKIYKLNQFEVDANGYVYIEDVGHIYVNGLTIERIKEAIGKKLPKYLTRDSKMEVSIIEKRQFVQVLGHVANPGVYIVREGANVQAALNMAGGAVDGAVMSDACILRKRGEEAERIKINLYQFTITGDPRLLTPLQENDILFVPISPNFGNIKRTLMPWTPPPEKLEEDVKNKVRIFGAVNDPGTYEPREDMNLLDLIVAAGGETDNADLSKILIVRKGNVDEIFNLQLFLNKESEEPLPRIKNGDMVYVKFRELTIYEPEEEKVFYVLGEVNRPDQYKLADNMTLFQAISMAGGVTEWADTENIAIVRVVTGKQENLRYNLENGIAGRVPEANIYIYPGDTIYVP